MTPIPKVPASKYPIIDGVAKIRFRIKGETNGPVYQGQRLIVPCPTCGNKPLVKSDQTP